MEIGLYPTPSGISLLIAPTDTGEYDRDQHDRHEHDRQVRGEPVALSQVAAELPPLSHARNFLHIASTLTRDADFAALGSRNRRTCQSGHRGHRLASVALHEPEDETVTVPCHGDTPCLDGHSPLKDESSIVAIRDVREDQNFSDTLMR
ncbi:hypothetical protein [Nonomuraea rubra]|uniref:hypothetical protein n=1 Tax=Nonomuraea rubra TaxID=46180 RepID=UPI0033C57BEC